MVVVVSPTTLPEPPVVGRRDDRGEIADMYPLKFVPGHRPADQRGGDVVEEARQNEHNQAQRKPALPVVRQHRGHFIRNPALLERARQQREAHEQQEQVRQDYPFVLHVLAEAREPDTELKSSEGELVCGYGCKSRQRDRKGMMME